MNFLEKKLQARFQEIPKNVTPGFCLQVYERGKKRVDLQWGKTWPIYDLASLTKIFFTVPALMHLHSHKKLVLSRSARSYLPWWPYDSSVQALLSHSAGNTWWQPFYKSMDLKQSVELRKWKLRQLLKATPVKKADGPVYSDIDFFLLGFLMEELFEADWSAIWKQLQEQWLKDSQIFFGPVKNKGRVAPTETCSWRKRSLQGEIHDENGASLGGIAPHAGLFGSIDGVSHMGLRFRELLQKDSRWIRSSSFHQFIKPQSRDWASGFMRPTPGASSSGKYFSRESFGHTGFTGTSFWMDPKQDLFVVLLSNRVHPTRKNATFRKWRPVIHDWVVEALQA